MSATETLFQGKPDGYYQGTYVDQHGHVPGNIAKPFAGPVLLPKEIPDSWVVPPFMVFAWFNNELEVVAQKSSDLEALKLVQK